MSDARSNSYIRINQRKPFKVVVCAITLVAFLVNTIAYDIAWAGGTPSELTSVGSDRATGPGLLRELDPATFKLPDSLGTIKDSWSPIASTLRRGQLSNKGLAHGEYELPQNAVVIHIQDAHCNYAAQTKIAEIVEYLNKEYGIDTINLEGGAREYDLSPFTDIKDKALRLKASDHFVREGLVNGAEYFAVNNPEKVTLWGIEDPKLYIDNLRIYRNSVRDKETIDKYLKSLSHILSNLKTKIYSKELFEFDLKYGQYKADNLEFKDYLSYLIQKSKEKSIDIKKFTDIYLLSQALDEESKIDFEKANNERDSLIDALQKKLSKRLLEELVLKSVEFKAERISQKDYYSYLAAKAAVVKIDLKDYPELQKYIVYIAMYDAINKANVMEEIGKLEEEIKKLLCQNDEEIKLSELSKNLALLKNIFGISITRQDYEYYKKNEDSFGMRKYISFITDKAPPYGITVTLDDSIRDLDKYREDMIGFYEYSFKRDVAFMKNIRLADNEKLSAKRYPLNANHATILITGGFHTDNLTELFKKNNIAYISIMPNFRNEDGYECPYYKLLSGEKSPDLRAELPSVLNTALAYGSQLCPAMRKALGGQSATTPVPAVRAPSPATISTVPTAANAVDNDRMVRLFDESLREGIQRAHAEKVDRYQKTLTNLTKGGKTITELSPWQRESLESLLRSTKSTYSEPVGGTEIIFYRAVTIEELRRIIENKGAIIPFCFQGDFKGTKFEDRIADGRALGVLTSHKSVDKHAEYLTSLTRGEEFARLLEGREGRFVLKIVLNSKRAYSTAQFGDSALEHEKEHVVPGVINAQEIVNLEQARQYLQESERSLPSVPAVLQTAAAVKPVVHAPSPAAAPAGAKFSRAREGRVLRIFDRDVVVVRLPFGKEQAFYRSTGQNSRDKGKWFPFDGVCPNPGTRAIAWFSKESYNSITLKKRNPELVGYGTEELRQAGEYLNNMQIPVGEEISEVRKINDFIGTDIAVREFNQHYDDLDSQRPEGDKIDDEVRRGLTGQASTITHPPAAAPALAKSEVVNEAKQELATELSSLRNREDRREQLSYEDYEEIAKRVLKACGSNISLFQEAMGRLSFMGSYHLFIVILQSQTVSKDLKISIVSGIMDGISRRMDSLERAIKADSSGTLRQVRLRLLNTRDINKVVQTANDAFGDDDELQHSLRDRANSLAYLSLLCNDLNRLDRALEVLSSNSNSFYHVSAVEFSDVREGMVLYPGVANAFGEGVYASQIPLLRYSGGEGLSLAVSDIVIFKFQLDGNSQKTLSTNPMEFYINGHTNGRAVRIKNITVREATVDELREAGAIGIDEAMAIGKKIYIVEAGEVEFVEKYKETAEYKKFAAENDIIVRLNNVKKSGSIVEYQEILKDIERFGLRDSKYLKVLLEQLAVQMAPQIKPADAPAGAGSWSKSPEWLRWAWLTESGTSILVGTIAVAILTHFGFGGIFRYLTGGVAAWLFFYLMHAFGNRAALKETSVKGLAVATGAVFMTLGFGDLGLSTGAVTGLLLYHFLNNLYKAYKARKEEERKEFNRLHWRDDKGAFRDVNRYDERGARGRFISREDAAKRDEEAKRSAEERVFGLGKEIGDPAAFRVRYVREQGQEREAALEEAIAGVKAAIIQRINRYFPSTYILSRLNRLTEHLAENAVDAVFERIDRGGLAETDGEITLKFFYNERKGSVSLMLSDNGIGIPREVLDGWSKGAFISTKTPAGEGESPYMGRSGGGVRDAFTKAKGFFSMMFATKREGRPGLVYEQKLDGTPSSVDSFSKILTGTHTIITVPADMADLSGLEPAAAPRTPAAPAPHAGFGIGMRAGSDGYMAEDAFMQEKAPLISMAKNGQLPDGFEPMMATIKGRTIRFAVQTNIAKRYDTPQRFQDFIESCIRIRGPTYEGRLLDNLSNKQGLILIDSVQRSPALYGNCENDNYIYINTATPEALDVIGVSHELMHEAGILTGSPDDEALLAKEDTKLMIEKGLLGAVTMLKNVEFTAGLEQALKSTAAERKNLPVYAAFNRVLGRNATGEEVAIFWVFYDRYKNSYASVANAAGYFSSTMLREGEYITLRGMGNTFAILVVTGPEREVGYGDGKAIDLPYKDLNDGVGRYLIRDAPETRQILERTKKFERMERGPMLFEWTEAPSAYQEDVCARFTPFGIRTKEGPYWNETRLSFYNNRLSLSIGSIVVSDMEYAKRMMGEANLNSMIEKLASKKIAADYRRFQGADITGEILVCILSLAGKEISNGKVISKLVRQFTEARNILSNILNNEPSIAMISEVIELTNQENGPDILIAAQRVADKTVSVEQAKRVEGPVAAPPAQTTPPPTIADIEFLRNVEFGAIGKCIYARTKAVAIGNKRLPGSRDDVITASREADEALEAARAEYAADTQQAEDVFWEIYKAIHGQQIMRERSSVRGYEGNKLILYNMMKRAHINLGDIKQSVTAPVRKGKRPDETVIITPAKPTPAPIPVAAPVAAKEMAVSTVGERTTAMTEAGAVVNMRDADVELLTGVPTGALSDMSIAAVMPVQTGVSRAFEKNGYGSYDAKKDLKAFEIPMNPNGTVDMESVKKIILNGIDKDMDPNKTLVICVPNIKGVCEIDAGPGSEFENECRKIHDKTILVPDAYSDSILNPGVKNAISTGRMKRYPDIGSRMMLARVVAWMYASPGDVDAAKAFRDYIGKLEGVRRGELVGLNNLQDILKKLNDSALRIMPIDYTDIDTWRNSQIATATAA